MGSKVKVKAGAGSRVAKLGAWPLQVSCSGPYREWLAAISDETMISMSAITRDAIRKWAADRGLPAPPCRD